METLKALHNHLIFQFEEKEKFQDGVSQFVEQTESGLEVVRHKDSVDAGRWAYTLFVGPDAEKEGFTPNMRVFIEPLKWTRGLRWGDDYIWRTDTDQILAIDDSYSGERREHNDHSNVSYQH